MSLTESEFSNLYSVRKLSEKDIETAYLLCTENPLFYRHCPPFVTRESIREDMKVLPPHTTPDQKHYVGFFYSGELIAILDLIDEYPKEDIAFIGFFMMRSKSQGQGIGSGIVQYLCDYLANRGYSAIRLAWVKENPQSSHFWQKNGFIPFGETANNGPYLLTLAQRNLQN